MTEYALVRSSRRTVAVQVGEGGRVTVRAPQRMPRREIDAFVAAQEDWIARRREEILERERAMQTVVLTQERLDALRRRGEAWLPALAARWAPRLGVTPAGITITNAAKRWGSCSARGRLCFSVRTLLLPEPCVEYIVVHELAHLREMNHSPRFYAVVERAMPDWRARADAVRAFERTHRIVQPGKDGK